VEHKSRHSYLRWREFDWPHLGEFRVQLSPNESVAVVIAQKCHNTTKLNRKTSETEAVIWGL